MTMDTVRLFIEPLDVLFLRGNKLFGEAGSFGESLVPPWPSVAAGAIRSALLVKKGLDAKAFAAGELDDPELGSCDKPGSFRVLGFHLARRHADGRIEVLRAPPSDLVVRRKDDGTLEVLRMRPHELKAGMLSSAATRLHAILPEPERGKPEGGYWLTESGWRAYREGRDIDARTQLLRTADLWSLDLRVGVGLDPARRSAAEGKLFTVQAVSMRKPYHDAKRPYDGAFLVDTEGARLPDEFLVRFGGDGRAARAVSIPVAADEADLCEEIARAGRGRLVLTSPGIFAGGWLPTGASKDESGEIRFELHGVKARVACAAVARAEVVSGWDLAKGRPKPAQRAAPAGSVYWLEDLEATAEQLRKLVAHGLWSEPAENPLRRTEGFNRFTFAKY